MLDKIIPINHFQVDIEYVFRYSYVVQRQLLYLPVKAVMIK